MSNGEVYYKAVSFYLEEHPDLLVDLLKVCPAARACLWAQRIGAALRLHCGQYHLPLTELASRGRASAELCPQPRTGAE